MQLAVWLFTHLCDLKMMSWSLKLEWKSSSMYIPCKIHERSHKIYICLCIHAQLHKRKKHSSLHSHQPFFRCINKKGKRQMESGEPSWNNKTITTKHDNKIGIPQLTRLLKRTSPLLGQPQESMGWWRWGGGGGHEFTFEKAGTHIELSKKKRKKRKKWRNNSTEEVSPADHKACCSTITVQQCKTVWPISCGFTLPWFFLPSHCLVCWFFPRLSESLAQLMLHFVGATERPTPVPSSPHGFWNCSVLPNHWRCTSGVYVPCIYSHTRWEAP